MVEVDLISRADGAEAAVLATWMCRLQGQSGEQLNLWRYPGLPDWTSLFRLERSLLTLQWHVFTIWQCSTTMLMFHHHAKIPLEQHDNASQRYWHYHEKFCVSGFGRQNCSCSVDLSRVYGRRALAMRSRVIQICSSHGATVPRCPATWSPGDRPGPPSWPWSCWVTRRCSTIRCTKQDVRAPVGPSGAGIHQWN